jgi:CubicO group peptidase (beta-lactamase class C family)
VNSEQGSVFAVQYLLANSLKHYPSHFTHQDSMSLPTPALEAVIHHYLGRTFPAAALVIHINNQEIYARAFGWLNPDATAEATRRPSFDYAQDKPDQATLFDLASVTKLFTVTAFMTYVEEGGITLDQPVCEVLPEFVGARRITPYPHPLKPGEVVAVVPATQETVEAGRVTFRHLLAHSSGLPAWLPLYREGSRERAYQMALQSEFAYPIGARVVYSDIGLILLGLALERITGQRLDAIVHERVTQPLGLQSIMYNPTQDPRGLHPELVEGRDLAGPGVLNIAPTEICAWRKRRLVGEVHDENAGGMEGVAGHAGLFGTARDVAALGQLYLRGGAPLLRRETVREMTRLHAHDGDVRRGLGFALWSPNLDASSNPFSPQTYGHTGFTGTSLWIDPIHELVVACLTNRVYYGRDNADDLARFRVMLAQAIAGSE